MWVMWDNDSNSFSGMVRSLPPHLEGRDAAHLALLGYRPLVTTKPEDFIPRFHRLLGNAKFELLEDGRVEQTFPDADFSVAAVRADLLRLAKADARTALDETDWYVVRQAEIGVEVPTDVLEMRARIRAHSLWLEGDIAAASPRALIEYQWFYPSRPDQRMVRGVPVIIDEIAPRPEYDVPDPNVAGVDGAPPPPEQQEVFPPEVLNPPPPPPKEVHEMREDPVPPPSSEPPEPPTTTDGPVPVYGEGDDDFTNRPHLDASGIPLVSVYDPNVGPPGPGPANN